MIERAPETWRALQDRVAQILTECGVTAKVERTIDTARGSVTVDIWAQDDAATPAQIYLVECKRWRARVPKTIVHAFRTVVGDSGANWGAIISSADFQRGAHDAARYSNVRLLNWEQFQALFERRWYQRYFLPTLGALAGPLIDYTEPINSRVFRKADALPLYDRKRFAHLREKHAGLSTLCVLFIAQALLGETAPLSDDPSKEQSAMNLPLRGSLSTSMVAASLTACPGVLDARTFRDLLVVIDESTRAAVLEFDDVFGERA